LINFILIGVCIAAGMLLKASNRIPENAHNGINTWIIYLAIPAVALKYIPAVKWSNDLLLPAVMPLIVWFGAWAVFKLYSRLFSLSQETRAALTLTAGLGNTSFVGFPLVQAYYGEHAISIAVISDQVTFVLMSTLGAMMAMSASSGKQPGAREVIKRLVQFPPFIAFILALILPLFFDLTPLNPFFDKVAATLVPLALFTVGLQLNFNGWQNELKLLLPGIGYKLIIAPALIAGIAFLFHLKGIVTQVGIFEAAMAPMITAGVIANQYQLNPKLANLMVGAGILLSFITTGLWWGALHLFA
jgi:malate permease and related proteins